MSENRKPILRFKTFTNVWEQLKVGECADITAGGTPSTGIEKYWYPKQVPWLSSGEVHKKEITFTDDMISVEGLNNSSASIIKENSVLIALAGQGKTRGTVAINRIPLSTNQSIAAMTFSPYICPEFVFSNLEGRYDEIRKMSSGDGSRGGLNKQLVSEIVIPHTSIEEQRAIGSMFAHLDRLITLHQRKFEKLQSIKKSMLIKMFARNDNLYPEIRLKGFNAPWKHYKLFECLEVSNEKNLDNTYSKQDVLSVSGDYGIVNQIEFQGRSFAGASVTNYGVVYTGDIVYTKSPLKSNPYGIIKANKGKAGIVSTLYAVYHPKENVDPDFIQIYFEQNARMNNYIQPLVNKGAKNDMKVSAENALKGDVIFPGFDEQRRIVSQFNTVDSLIVLHRQKYEKLQNIKKKE